MSRKAAKRTLLISGAVIALAGIVLVFMTTLGRGTLSLGGQEFDMVTRLCC